MNTEPLFYEYVRLTSYPGLKSSTLVPGQSAVQAGPEHKDWGLLACLLALDGNPFHYGPAPRICRFSDIAPHVSQTGGLVRSRRRRRFAEHSSSSSFRCAAALWASEPFHSPPAPSVGPTLNGVGHGGHRGSTATSVRLQHHGFGAPNHCPLSCSPQNQTAARCAWKFKDPRTLEPAPVDRLFRLAKTLKTAVCRSCECQLSPWRLAVEMMMRMLPAERPPQFPLKTAWEPCDQPNL